MNVLHHIVDQFIRLGVLATQISATQYDYYNELSVAKRKECLQPEKTHGYQYLFTVQFFDSYVYRSRINKGHLGGLDKVF